MVRITHCSQAVNVKLYSVTLRNAVLALEEYISSSEEFMEHVVVRLRKAYKQSRQQSDLRKFLQNVTNGTVPQAIEDVSFNANSNNVVLIQVTLVSCIGSITS